MRVVIVGAGITGSLTAWRLARTGHTVTLIEARYPGAGSSSRTAAGIRQQYTTRESVVGMRYAVSFYRDFCKEVGGETVPIVQNGYLFLYNLDEHWDMAKRRVRLQKNWGLSEVEALDVGALAERFPWVERLALLGGTFCPSDGFLRPDVIYQEACAAAQRLGATLVQGAPVVGAERSGNQLVAVRTPKGIFGGDVFIDATNAWSPRLAEVLGATVLPISPLKRYLWMLERGGSMGDAEFEAMPLVIAPSGAYCRPENSGSLLMGWAHNASPEPEFTYEDQDRIEEHFYHKSGVESAGFETWASLAEVVPALGEFAGITATTSGYYATTPDHNPFLDFDPGTPNLLRLAGFSGHGAMFGPFTSALAEHKLSGGGGMLEVPTGAVDLGSFGIGRDLSHAESLVI